MSDRLAAKIKENAGKPKYSSLNLNQTYKGNKVEIKTSSGATRHGLQSLGKIGSSRRIPPPANLPSLKSENSGNDPTVSLVPSGGGGWGSAKDKPDSAAVPSSSTPPPTSFQPPQPTVVVSQQPALQPQRPTGPSSFPSSQTPAQQPSQSSGPTRQETTTVTTTTQQEKSEAQTKTWGSVPQSEAGGQAKTYSHQPTPYFNREFPTLGGPDGGETKQDGKESSQGPAPIVRNTHEPPWMERSGPGPPPHGYRNNDMYNGAPGQGPHNRRPIDYQNNRNNPQYPPQNFGNNYYQGQGGRPPPHGFPGTDQHGRPTHPRASQGPRPGPGPGARPDKRQDLDRDGEKPAVRPSVLRPEDIQAMDDEEDDGGWAGAHGEVDYSAKLNFEDFEDEEKERNKEYKDKGRPRKEERGDQKVAREEDQQPTELKKAPEGQKELLRRPTPDTDRPEPPKSAWGELPQRPAQYNDTNRQGPQPGRTFDNHRPPPASRQTPPWNTQYPTPNQAQHRVPPGQYPPLSGSPPTGRDPSPGRPPKQEGPPTRREGEPADEWSLRRQKQHDEMHAAVERARKRREQEELDYQAKTKAAAMSKLKAIEDKTKSTEGTPVESHEKPNEKPKSESERTDTFERDRDEKDGDQTIQPPDQNISQLRPEDSSRRRNDSDSSDASRGSGSRQFYHQQRSIPPRFQQQRQQQQQQYQQQQLYQATHPPSVHHHPPRELLDVASPVVRLPQTSDSGPVSPSGKTNRPGETVPVKRIMKRSDSSSTAGDDVASLKSLESVGDRETGSRPRLGTASSTEQEVTKPETKPQSKDSEARRKDSKESRNEELQEDKKAKDVEKQRDRQRTSEKKTDVKEDDTSANVPRKREYHSNDRKIEEPNKRKREENEEADYEERKNKLSRERQTDGRGRLRPGSSVRGRGRGIGRGRQEYRGGGNDNRQRHVRDSRSRDYRENREQRKESFDKNEKPREPLKTDDQNKDYKVKVSTDDTKEKPERPPPKKEEKSAPDQENQERKTSHQEKPSRETQEKGRTERKGDRERFEKRNDRFEKRDDRDQRPKWRPSESRRDSSKDHRDDPRRSRFASRDIREDEKYANQRSFRDGERYQDRYKQDHNRTKDRERDTDAYKDKAKEQETDSYKDKAKECESDSSKDKPKEHEPENYKEKAKEQETEAHKDRAKEHETEVCKDKPKEHETGQDRDKPRRDYDRYRDKESPRNRRELTTRHERGGHRGQLSTRGRGAGAIGRGVRRGPTGRVGSGRMVASNYVRIPKREELSSEDEDDDSTSESSSYTTATSASEEKPDEKEEKPKEQPRSASQSSNTSRGLKSTRGTRGRGGSYVRSRPQQEKPPRFQKQQERAAQQRSSGRGGFRSDRDAVRGSRGRGRGRGRGRIVSNSRDTEDKDGTTIAATEDWEDDVDSGSKGQTKEEKPSRRGGFPPRPSSDRNANQRRGTSRDESGKPAPRRDGSQHNSQPRKGETFLAEKQVKVEGSKSASGEPRGTLPAAKNVDLASSKKSSGTPKDEKKVDYSAVDSIDGKVPVKRNEMVKKANIELYDLHNVAGVICIDEFPDDASDISSSGFVEVTSKRTQKELKEKQREEDERRKRTEEKANQRSADSKFKKNQANKPPRFSKQHQGSGTPTQSKSFDGKLPVTISLEGAPGLVSGNIGSNSSSTNSTKRNSPVTVERPLSPQGPVFNAWNKPLTLVTPAKPPGTSLVMTSDVPDPLAVGSGKPSRQTQPTTVIPLQNSLIYSNIDDKSAEDELKEMTKEIESMAPTEEQEEVSAVPAKTNKKPTSETTSSSGREKRHETEKKSQPKPQRERPPRFERTAKRKSGNDEKKDFVKQNGGKKEKEASLKLSDDETFIASKNKSTEDKKFDSVNPGKDDKETPDVKSTSKAVELEANDAEDKENEKDSIAPRKDSDYSVDSEGQASGDSSMFSGRPLSVNIADSSSETPDRPPTPVSPAYAEMSKKMFAARKAWECAPTSSVGLTGVGIDSPSAWSESSSSSVTRSVVSSATKDTSPLGEGGSDSTSESRESSEASVSKSDVTKPAETQFIAKKTGGNEQQNVCKVKPQQQQQAVKPQHASLTASATEERRQPDLDAMTPAQPVLSHDHRLSQNIHSSYQFQLEPQLLQLQHRQPQHFMQPLQSLQQSTQVPTNRYQITAQMQQVPHQPASAPSPLSQSPQELFQSQYLASNLYSASGFPGSPPFVSIPIVATTTTPSYATSSTRTQNLPGQPAKTATSSMFGQPGSQTQTVYMPFDPQSIPGTATLLNFSQQSQAQRQLMGNHPVGFTDVLTQQPQPRMPPHGNQPQALQQFQGPFAFQTKLTSYDSEHNTSIKPVDQGQGDFSHPQSEMVKHINAKPFEPPKRLSTPTSLPTSSSGNVGLMVSNVNPNVVHIRPNPPNMGPLSHSPPMQTSFISRPISMSPVDPTVPFAAGASSFAKHAPIGPYQIAQQQRQQPPIQQFTPFQQQPVHIKPQQLQQHQTAVRMQQGLPNQHHSPQQHGATHIAVSAAHGVPPQALIQRQYGAVGTVGPTQHTVGNQRFPGPIQRPPSAVMVPQNILQHQPRPGQQPRPIRQQVPRLPHNMQKPPLLPMRPPLPPQQMQISTQQNPFKALQHQKMLQETRKFFETQDQQTKAAKSQTQQSGADKLPNQPGFQGQLPQQQTQKQGQSAPQSIVKQTQPQPKPVQDSKATQQHSRQSLHNKQIPLAPSSGAHHSNKPPRMSQENKQKQSNQDKKDKKEENKSHIIELPRKKTQDSGNKSKPTKSDSFKSEDASQTSKPDGKSAANKRGGPIRIAPMIQKLPQGNNRGNRPNKPRGPPMRNTNPSVQPNKPKTEVSTSATTTVATGTPTTATTTTTTSKPVNEAVVSSKGKDLAAPRPKESEEVKATDPLTVAS